MWSAASAIATISGRWVIPERASSPDSSFPLLAFGGQGRQQQYRTKMGRRAANGGGVSLSCYAYSANGAPGVAQRRPVER